MASASLFTLTKKKIIDGLLVGSMAAAGVVAVPQTASAAPACDWTKSDCNFVVVSFKPARIGKVCETPLDAQRNPIGDKECDTVGMRGVSHYWIPQNADSVAFTYDADVTGFSGGKTSLFLKNDRDWCFRVTFWTATFHEVPDNCTPD